MRSLSAALAALVAAAAPAPARAATMEVAPVVIDLGPAAPSAIITIRNRGTTTTRYQLSAMAWTEPTTGEPRLEPDRELSFFPPLFQLAPGEERKIRVGATVPPGPAERAWRLFVEELPQAVDSSPAGASVRIRTRFALPVFLAPALPRASAAVSLVRPGGDVAAVLENRGNVRVKPSQLSVSFLGGGGEILHAVDLPPVAVLSGAKQTAEVKAPAEVCAKVRSARLEAEIEGEKRRAELALPAGACAP